MRSLISFIIGILVAVPLLAFAVPSSVDRITDRIEPLIKTDSVRGLFFTASSTSATSTFPRLASTVIVATTSLSVGTTTSIDEITVAGTNAGIRLIDTVSNDASYVYTDATGDQRLGVTGSGDSIIFDSFIGSNLTPITDVLYDLGTAARNWQNIYLDETSGCVYFGNCVLSGSPSSDGIEVGTGGANAIVTSSGNFDLVLRTGNGTTGNLTIQDGANGDFVLSPNGSGAVGIGSSTPNQTLSVAGDAWFNGSATATDITATGTLRVGTLTGLLKAASGVVSQAVAGTDYLTAAITSLGGQTGATQTFATSTPSSGGWGFSSATNVHTMTIPQAGASSPFGLLSSADFTTFNNKADLSSAMTGTFDGNNFAGGAIASGDLLYGSGAGTIAELSIGTAGQILMVQGGVPVWFSTSTLLMESEADTSSELRSLLTDETGTGAAMFGITAAMSDDISCGASQVLARNSGDSAWECVTQTAGGGGGGVSTTTDNNPEVSEVVSYVTTDFYIGGSASNTAEFNLDPESGTLTLSSTTASGGFIGIGTTSQRAALNVEGSAFITGNATVTSITATGSATSTLANLSITGGISLLGEYFTNFTTYVRSLFSEGSTGIDYSAGAISFDCTEVEGTGINCATNAITLDATGDWTGTFDGQQGTWYIDRANHSGTQLAATISDFVSTVRTSISETITGLGYDSGTGVLSLDAGYTIPLTASTTEWNTFYTTPSSRITAGTGLSWSGNTLNATGGSGITSLGGQTGATQTFASSSPASGGWGISSAADTHTLTIPTAGLGSPLGLLSSADWSAFNGRVATTSIDTIAELEAVLGGTNVIVSGEIDTLAELETIMGGINILAATEIDTMAELEAIVGSTNIIQSTEIDTIGEIETLTSSDIVTVTADDITAAELLSIVNGDTGTGNLVFSASPTFTGTANFANSSTTVGSFGAWFAGQTATTSVTTGGDLIVGGGDITLGSQSIFSGGDTASLNNIDAIDATTETTFEAAIDTLTALTTVAISTVLDIVSGTNPTVDAEGEMALDTTDDQLLIADAGGTARVFATDEFKIKDMTIASSSYWFASGRSLPVGAHKDGLEVTQIICWVDGGTSKTINLTDGTNDTETVACGTSVTADTDIATNDTFTAQEKMYVEMGATSGTMDSVHIEVYARITRE